MPGGKLRILYYVDSLGLGGANQTTVTVAREMKSRGHEVVFASAPGPLARRLDEVSIPHVPIRTAVRHPSWAAARALLRSTRRYGIDLICSNGFDCTIDAIPCALISGKPLLPTYGGLFPPPYPHPWLPRVNVFSTELSLDLERRFGWQSSTFRRLIARLDGERFHPGVDGSGFRQELGIEPDRPILVMVCRHDAAKLAGVMVLLDAAMDIRAAVPRSRIVLLGDGDGHDEVLARVQAIHGQVGETLVIAAGSREDIAEAFAASELVVANGARSALEAMACGRAVVSVGANGFCGVLTPETIEGFRNFNFDKGRLAGNPLAGRSNLVRAVERILTDGDLRRGLEEFSAGYAREHLLIQSAADRFELLYRETVADPWMGRGGRIRVGLAWLSVLMKFYAHRWRLRKQRRSGSGGAADADRFQAPPPGLDPDWCIGLTLKEDASRREAPS